MGKNFAFKMTTIKRLYSQSTVVKYGIKIKADIEFRFNENACVQSVCVCFFL